MSSTIGSTRNLDASRKEALQGLLSSLGNANDNPSSDGKLSAEQVRKLSEKINDILGDGSGLSSIQANWSGQFSNEEGLPIIDISESVHGDSLSSSSLPSIPEPEFTPLSLLPPNEKERRRREQERILDFLEAEERLQQLQEERSVEEGRKETIRKRKDLAMAELERLRATRELQKKMGQALVRHVKGAEGKRQEERAHLKPRVTSPVAKKSVSFSDAPADTRGQQTSIRQPDWGDVTLGRLRAQDRIPLVSTAEAQRYPIKMHVVERHSTATYTPPFCSDADSDDESTSTGDLPPHAESGSSDDEDKSSSGDNLLDDELLEEGFDYDYDAAQHHREIALEYHKMRHTISAETAKVMAARDLDDSEQRETSPLSHFRVDRMAAAYDKSHNPVSTSAGQTILPALRQKTLRDSVRLGKVENNQLVGEESGESGNEDENVREVIRMLKAGDVQNAGPNFNPSLGPEEPTTSSVAARGTKPSKFILARGGGITGSTQDDNNTQSQRTVSNVVERRAPRSSPNRQFPANKPPPRFSVKALEHRSP